MEKKFTITPINFLEWYYEDGQDSENKELKEDLAEMVISHWKRGLLPTVADIFENANLSAIKCEFFKEFDMDVDPTYQDVELSDYVNRKGIGEFKVILLSN